MKQIVIFDFDGTLANSIGLAIRLYNQHAQQFGTEPIDQSELDDLRKMARDHGYKQVLKHKKVGLTKLPSIVLTIGKEMRSHMAEVKPYEGIITALQELKARGYRLGVLTSNQEHLVREFLETHQYPLFDFIVSEKTLFGKDKALKRIMKKFALDSRGVVYVGDEVRDVAACNKALIDVIAVTWGVAGVGGFDKVAPTKIIDTPRQLVPTITQL
jgi:phosphoglycolate phosphatase